MSADASFEKLSRGDRRLYGPRKLLLGGFPAMAQTKFETVLGMAGLSDVPRVWLTAGDLEERIATLMERPADTGLGVSSTLPRTIIVAGIAERSLHALMTVCRKSGMTAALWAALTPTSQAWTLSALLAALSAEREALAAQRPGKRGG